MWHRNQEKTNKLKELRRFYCEYMGTKITSEKIEVKPYISSYRQHLIPIESYCNKEVGLQEAVEASSDYINFSQKIRKFCEAKSWCVRTNFMREYNISDLHKDYFDENNRYKKGKLSLHLIYKKEYKKLSPDAKKWFEEKIIVEKIRNGYYRQTVYCIMDRVNMTWLKEVCRKIYTNYIYKPIPEVVSRLDYLKRRVFINHRWYSKINHEFLSRKVRSCNCKYICYL